MAISPVTLAFSLFWAMEALISSMEALVSSTLAACSEAPWLRDCAVELSCSEAFTRVLEASLTEVIVAVNLSTVVLLAALRRLNAPRYSLEIVSVRLPWAMASSTRTVSSMAFLQASLVVLQAAFSRPKAPS